MKMRKKWMIYVITAIATISLVLTGCSNGDTETSPNTNSANSDSSKDNAKTTTVKLAALPYPDDMIWFIGLQKEWDKALGLDVKTSWFADETKAEPALARGDVDVAMGAMAPSVVLGAQIPNIVDVSLTSMYQAFSVVTRNSEFETYDDLVKKGQSPEEAAKNAIKQLQGKKLVTTKGLFDAPIQSMLTVAGMSMDDLTIINMEQTEGSLAFAQGTGDAYVGGLPSEEKLLSSPDYAPLVSSPQMGPGALYLGGLFATKEYLSDHKDVVLKLLAMYYRGVNYLNEHPKDAFKIMTNVLNKQTGNDWKPSYYQGLVPKKVFFPTYSEALETVYNPEWYGYWKDNLDYFVKADTASGAFNGKKLPESFMQAPQIFEELKQDQQLWDFVNKD